MKHTQLFFDDSRLFGRGGTTRAYGVPSLACEYSDPDFSTDYCSPWVLLVDGRYVMLYMGTHRSSKKQVVLAAVSNDGCTSSRSTAPMFPSRTGFRTTRSCRLPPARSR